MSSQEEGERDRLGCLEAAALLCLLGVEAGVKFPRLHHLFWGKGGVEVNLGCRSRSEGVNIMEVRWIC